jgi:hypothetical protein
MSDQQWEEQFSAPSDLSVRTDRVLSIERLPTHPGVRSTGNAELVYSKKETPFSHQDFASGRSIAAGSHRICGENFR